MATLSYTDNSTLAALAKDHPDYGQRFNDQLNTFASQFENYVGRAPTSDEVNKFTTNYLVPNSNDIAVHPDYGQVANMSSNIQQFLGDNYQNAAKDYATQQLTDQQGQANSLADLFRSQGNSAINSTEQSLLDYQSQLFDKLRPNLITSLKAQGLLDTGGLNVAMAGEQGDLANNASQYISQLKLQNEQGANAIAFGGASAPYQYNQAQIQNSVPYLQAMGQNAMNQNNSTFLNNLNFSHQLQLQNNAGSIQAGMQPSFLRTMGQNFAGSFGQSLGQYSAAGVNNSTFGSKQPPPGGAPAYAMLA